MGERSEWAAITTQRVGSREGGPKPVQNIGVYQGVRSKSHKSINALSRALLGTKWAGQPRQIGSERQKLDPIADVVGIHE